jgi:hypothetical protein
MTWSDDLASLAKWAIQTEDLRHRFLYASSAAELEKTPGITQALETSVVLSIYEAARRMRYEAGKTVAYERAYPGEISKNPKRADLAFKEPGPGKNWAYVEVKYYGLPGKKAISDDIKKLRSIKQSSQRWILCYRVRPSLTDKKRGKKAGTLEDLLKKNFNEELKIVVKKSVSTIGDDSRFAVCDIVLAKVQ